MRLSHVCVCVCTLASLTDWGLYFYHFSRLRERCQLGHAGIAGLDFTLGRFVKEAESDTYMRRSCKMSWRAYWRPPTSKAMVVLATARATIIMATWTRPSSPRPSARRARRS